jgi:hypothetical protein
LAAGRAQSVNLLPRPFGLVDSHKGAALAAVYQGKKFFDKTCAVENSERVHPDEKILPPQHVKAVSNLQDQTL